MEKNKESDQQNLPLSLLVEEVRWLKEQKCSIEERIDKLESKIASIQQQAQETPIAPPPLSSQADESITTKYKLVIRSVVNEIVHIGCPIGTWEGNGITVVVEDLQGNQIAAGHHLASLKVELVVVKAEFYENVWDWTKDEFEASVIKTDSVKEKIKSAIFQLKDGKGVHENTRIHKSSNKQYVKLGVKVIEHTGERVLEGVSNSFFVQHRPRGNKSKEGSSPRSRRENSPTKERRGGKRRATNNGLVPLELPVFSRQPSQHVGTSNAGTDTDTSMGTDVTDDDDTPHNFGDNFLHDGVHRDPVLDMDDVTFLEFWDNLFASGQLSTALPLVTPNDEANHRSAQGQIMGNGTDDHNQRGHSHGNAYMPCTNSQDTLPEIQVDPSAYPHHSSAQGQMMGAGYWTIGRYPTLVDAQYHQGYSFPNEHCKAFAAKEEHQIAYGPLNYGEGQVSLGLRSFVPRPRLNHKASAYSLHTRRSSPGPLLLPLDSLQLKMGCLSINDEFAMMMMVMMVISSQAIWQNPPKEIVLVEQEPSVKQKSHAFCGDNNNEVTESYDHFVIVDLKATGEKGVNINPLEIIEFSSILVDAVTGQQASTFHTYVCPIMHPELSEFCKEYNGILQTNVEAGVMLSEALQMHQAWLKEAETKNGGSLSFAVVTWGDWDCRTILMQECSFKHVTIPYYFYQWINLKKPFAEKFGDNYLLAPVLEAVQAAGLKWKGCPKGGQSHADNKARLLELLIRHSAKLYITDNLLAM
ncbi:uncharacterized protein [Aegilops tauschii subsp. strangulata]|uniref:Exonuclease domain-containing protein n=3 Tax=Aegilops tauschii subsp. strangulata TaxID=200361 RepID=A0A453A4N2_AEGTS|nr:uncharacterized protein LOC109783181 isoform X4 [Aegilops tauschii subsp. strangulata]